MTCNQNQNRLMKESVEFNGKPIPFLTAEAARAHAAGFLPLKRIVILESRHADNKHGNFFIDSPDSMVRSWETVLFVGLGKAANKPPGRVSA